MEPPRRTLRMITAAAETRPLAPANDRRSGRGLGGEGGRESAVVFSFALRSRKSSRAGSDGPPNRSVERALARDPACRVIRCAAVLLYISPPPPPLPRHVFRLLYPASSPREFPKLVRPPRKVLTRSILRRDGRRAKGNRRAKGLSWECRTTYR